MADSSTLREYLVALGFRVDEAQFKKFSGALATTAEGAATLAATLSAAAVVTTAFVDKVTRGLSELYWASQKIGSSVSQIQSFRLAIQKLGGSAENAQSSLEGVARLLRTNPAAESFFHLLGVQTRDANGNLRQTVPLMSDLAVQFKRLTDQHQYWLAARYGNILGIDEDTVLAMSKMGKFVNEYADFYKRAGIDPDKAAKAATVFRNRMADLNAEFQVMEAELGMRLLPLAEQLLDWLIKAARPGGDLSQIFKDIGDVAPAIGAVAIAVGELAKGALHLLAMLPSEALEFGVIGYFLFGKKAAVVMAAIGALSALGDWVIGDKKKVNESKTQEYGTSDKYKVNRWLYENGLGYLNTNEFNTTYGAYKARQGQQQVDNALPPSSGNAIPYAAPPGSPRGIRNNNPGNLRSWGSAPVVGGFARFQNAAQGLSAMAGNLLVYMNRGWNSLRQIAMHWAPPGENNTAAYIQNLMKRTGFGADAALDLRNPAVLQRVMSAIIANENGQNPYSSAMIAAAANSRLMGKSAPLGAGGGSGKVVSISQKTDIHVNGADSPRETAKHVSSEQGRVNGDLVRNTKTAVM